MENSPSIYDQVKEKLGDYTDTSILLVYKLLQLKLGLHETETKGQYINSKGEKFVLTLYGFMKLD